MAHRLFQNACLVRSKNSLTPLHVEAERERERERKRERERDSVCVREREVIVYVCVCVFVRACVRACKRVRIYKVSVHNL